MPRAIWNGKVVAESNATVVVDSNHYFPPDSMSVGLFREDFDTHRLRLERDSRLLHAQGRRPGEPRRRMELSRREGRCKEHREVLCVLERRDGRSIIIFSSSSSFDET